MTKQPSAASAPFLPECTVCFDTPDGAIHQCAEGHLICFACDKLLLTRACPTCKLDLAPPAKRIRNRAVEETIATSMTECEHCTVEMTRDEIKNHQPCEHSILMKTFGNRKEKYSGGLFANFMETAGDHQDGRLIEAHYRDMTLSYNGLTGEETVVSIRYHAPHYRDGITQWLEYGKLVREEFRAPHIEDGMTVYLEDREVVRNEIRAPHKDAGMIIHYKKNDVVCEEFHAPHGRDGSTRYFEDRMIVRNEIRPPHKDAGMMIHYKNNKVVREEYRAPHKYDGLTRYNVNGKVVREEFRAPHEKDGTHRGLPELRWVVSVIELPQKTGRVQR